jgi:hypothetical protein
MPAVICSTKERNIVARNKDKVLRHITKPLFEQLVDMWKRSNCGLDFCPWFAQRVEVDIIIPGVRAQQAAGVNSKPKPAPPRKKSGSCEFTREQVQEIKAAVVAGRIRPDSDVALAAAACEQEQL